MDFRSDNERTERSKSTVTRAGKQTCKIQTKFFYVIKYVMIIKRHERGEDVLTLHQSNGKP